MADSNSRRAYCWQKHITIKKTRSTRTELNNIKPIKLLSTRLPMWPISKRRLSASVNNWTPFSFEDAFLWNLYYNIPCNGGQSHPKRHRTHRFYWDKLTQSWLPLRIHVAWCFWPFYFLAFPNFPHYFRTNKSGQFVEYREVPTCAIVHHCEKNC